MSSVDAVQKSSERFEVDSDTTIFYTEGECWRLALEIQRQAGLPIVALGIYWPESKYELDQGGLFEWAHIANILPDGRILDITGAWAEEDFVKHWNLKFAEDFILLPYSDKDLRDYLKGDYHKYAFSEVIPRLEVDAALTLERANFVRE